MKRLVRILTTAVLIPVAAAAQAPAPAQSANPMMGAFKASAYYGPWLVQAFDSIPASLYGYKPMPVQLSVGAIATHLEHANYLLCGRFSGTEHPMTAKDSTADSVKAGWPKDTLVARLQASLTFCDSAMARLTDASLAENVPLGPGRTGPRVRLLIVYLTDLAEHYSQIAGYMRMNNMVPPSALPRRRM